MNVLAIIDGGGIYGEILHYSLTIALVGSALIVFFYLWMKGKLDMDEEPKTQMLDEKDPCLDEEQDD